MLLFWFSVIFGFLAAYLATYKNRNPIAWFLSGFFFGLFGIAILIILPELKPSNPTYQQNVYIQPTIIPTIDPIPDTEKWFYLNANKQAIGPLSFANLVIFLKDKDQYETINIDPGMIWIWKKGMENWERAMNISQINEAIKKP